ncbi:4-phosphoerythronate dehydrogenase [Parashewanella spongiae]|uniref:Erythronate-4-phosphate dehydrogenase n=1 Tax=Parashewanella spongiae TaxID=342950 RepID=A0A3A6U4R2_9GAMM|nr:4-phosphoerythronate dehydrogenase [Parashewanella spongiae]MCL1078190.1 4-phosphoerythronate dehydrogenase [Parashewanella spongiae]RJY16385.1 4-phosphoerythronate dehydrogenase [Parashewanella spongiae]
MKILADENMPYAEDLFREFGEVELVDGRSITASQTADADILLVRSVTKVNQQLLANSNKLKFVGTATIGTDHVDIDYLLSKNIAFSSAPGCNAIAVGEFAFIAMLELAKRFSSPLKEKTVGIVGAGNTGAAVARCLTAYGVKVLLCDPIKEAEGDSRSFCSLDDILARCDVISLHVPLTQNGEFKTCYLFDELRLNALKKNAWLLNCCRGEVIDNNALIKVKQTRPDLKLVLDVWEGEPFPMSELIPLAELATPHIAGYSMEGKARGTLMLYQKVCELLNRPSSKSITSLLPEFMVSNLTVNTSISESELLRIIRLVYDVRDDDQKFRSIDFVNGGFDQMRKSHRHRREFSALIIESCIQSNVSWINELGFTGAKG